MKFVKRFFIPLLVVCLALSFTSVIFAEGTSLTGEWVFTDIPENSVMTLNDDGSAVYGGQDLVWEDQNDALLLTDAAGGSLRLPYTCTEKGITVWLPSLFERISEIGGEGEIIGTWKAQGESMSSFVFMEDGKFLEDGVFAGNYTHDAENARITLKYQDPFADTDIYYAFADGMLAVYYPWALSRK